MIRLAVVGDIGSGKSHVAKQFGYPVFNADVEVVRLYKKSRKCYNKLKKILPKYIISFPIEKNEIGKAILGSPNNLNKIIKIIHPEVQLRMNKFIRKNKKNKFVVLDIPLLLENKINRKSDILIFIDAKKGEIYKKLKKRPNFKREIIEKFKKLQLPVGFKKKKSDYIIKNNFRNNYLKKDVKKLLKKIILNA